MKIDQLPIGTRFQWKGRSYTKVGPMTAAADAGGVPVPGSPRRSSSSRLRGLWPRRAGHPSRVAWS